MLHSSFDDAQQQGTPNFFLIDAQPEAKITSSILQEACRQIKRNRIQYLRDTPTEDIVSIISGISENWTDDLYPFRKRALDEGPSKTGFSRSSIAHGLDQFFTKITEENLLNLIAQELGDSRRLDSPLGTPEERAENRSSMARGPELITIITAGSPPCPTIMTMIHGLIVGSAQFIKCADKGGFIPRLFAHSLYESHPKIGSCIEISSWPGTEPTLEKILFDESDCIIATGRDETINSIRSKITNDKKFIGYGQKVSLAYIQKDMLSRAMARELAKSAAQDIASWNQLGCLSPHIIYIEKGGAVSPELFSGMLAESLAAIENLQPRGDIPAEIDGDILYKRKFFESRALRTGDVRQWSSETDTSWTVVFEEDPLFTTSCQNRFIHVKSINDIDEMLRVAEMTRGQVSTVGLSAPKNEAEILFKKLAHWGVTRICPIGKMQEPALGWRHDGRPTIADLVSWTDWEQ